MEKIKFYFGSLTKGSVDENARFLEYVLKNTKESVGFLGDIFFWNHNFGEISIHFEPSKRIVNRELLSDRT